MDTNNLAKFVGKEHEEEVRAIITEHGDIAERIHWKNPTITLFLSVFLGMFAIDRLYQSGVKVFLCKLAMLLFTLGTWWIVDIGYSIKFTQQRNYDRLIAFQGQ